MKGGLLMQRQFAKFTNPTNWYLFMSKAAATRLNILQKAFELIYTKGYLTTSIDEIIANTQVTKGAFFYHFRNKDEMGLAIIEEVLKPTMLHGFIAPLAASKDPVRDLYKLMKHLLLENEVLQAAYGCPAGNFTQEMAPWNEAFTSALSGLVKQWETVIRKSIANGKSAGLIRKEVNGMQVATFLMSGYWGIRNLGKLYETDHCYKTYLKELKVYLNGLQ